MSTTGRDPKYDEQPAISEQIKQPVMTEQNSGIEGGREFQMYLGARAEKIKNSAAMNICNQIAAWVPVM